MLRIVAFKKAILAGVAGALVWEVAVRLLELGGLPTFDIVRELGLLAFPNGRPAEWWLAGMAVHALVGAAWAIFYAYFFWAVFRAWPAALQGLAFSVLPLVLATLLIYPKLQLMHLHQDLAQLDLRSFLAAFRDGNITGLTFGHALFGLTVGIIYTHPAGYRADLPPRRPRPRHRSGHKVELARSNPYGFIFATGIECSYPTVEHGRWRRDEMKSTEHYERWREDFDRAREVGITHIRYGPPLHLIFTGPAQYDWSWIDEPMRELREFGPEPIVDLCHFGVPSWLENFQNPGIENALAEYAGAFAERYPWVRFYTPINEMYVCARMSALEGVWNEQLKDERAFARAAVNLAGACVAMTNAILAVRTDAVFINSESSEFSQSCCPDDEIDRIAEFENERRFLPLDLIYSTQVSPAIRDYLRDHDIGDDQYSRFMNGKTPRRSVIGLDYYEWNERLIDSEGQVRSLGEHRPSGLKAISDIPPDRSSAAARARGESAGRNDSLHPSGWQTCHRDRNRLSDETRDL
jgi:hypothetical protein